MHFTPRGGVIALCRVSSKLTVHGGVLAHPTVEPTLLKFLDGV